MSSYNELTKTAEETALQRYYRLKAEAQYKKDVTEQLQPETVKEETNKGGLLGGIGYGLEKLGLGALRSIESAGDYIVGGAAKLFGADDFANDLMQNDWVDYGHADEWYNPSEAMEFVGNAAEGFGGVLPDIAVKAIPGVGPALSAATFVTSAAGQAVSDAAKKSGYAGGKEWGYGTLSGIAEGGIEAISGGLGGTQMGKVLGKQVAKSTAGKVASSFIGEGLEEVASDFIDPALKRVTGVDKNATVDWKQLPKTFLVGGTVGAALGGAGRAVNASRVGGFNNLNAIEAAQEYSTRAADNNIRQAQGKKQTYTQADMETTKQRLSGNLVKMDENTRAKFFEQNPKIAPLFETDGRIKAISTNKPSYNENAYSASLKGRESELIYKPVSADTEAGGKAMQAMKNIQLITNGKSDVVLTDTPIMTADGREANGAYVNGVLYLNTNATDEAKVNFVASHELVHTLEGTREYGKLASFIDEVIKSDERLQEKYNLDRYLATYAGAQGDKYSAETRVYEAQTELIADFMADEVLKNPDTVRRLAAKNENVFKRILEWLRAKIRQIRAKGGEKTGLNTLYKAERLFSAALENRVGGVSLDRVEKAVQAEKAKGEGVDTNSQMLYNEGAVGAQQSRYSLIYRTFPTYKEWKGTQANELATRWAHRVDIISGDRTAISYHDKWYLIEKFEDSDLGYQIVAELTEQQYKDYMEERNNDIGKGQSIQKGISRLTSINRRRVFSNGRVVSDNSVSPRNGRSNNEIRGVGEEQSQRGKTESNGGGDSKSRRSSEQRIRYSLKVGDDSISGTVEETKNLVALHNLSEASLMKVLQLGGFPMPSIAVTKVDMGHTEYGDITIVFGRETIDPQADRRNKVYSRDGWTPTAPKVEYKPNERVLSKIHKKYSELVSKVGYDATRVLYNYVKDIEHQLELHGGEIGIISELYDNTELMNLFLVDTGSELIKPIYKTIRSELSQGEVAYRKRLIDALGKDFLSEFEKTSGDRNTRKDFVKQHREQIVNALATIMQGKESIEETRENISKDFSVFALGNTLNKATSYLKNGGVSVSVEYDATATQEAIRKATSKREYVAWVDKLFGGIEEKTGIYNGRDPYTNSGNRRSFEALHYEYTLENMVEVMLDAPENGGSSWHGLSLGQLQAKLAKEFKSIDEIRLNADNLTVKDEAAHEEFSETTRKMLSEITALMVDESKYGSDSVAYWTALDSAEMVVGEIADNRLFTLEKIAAYMKREYSTAYRYNDSIGNKILGLFEYVRRENDTGYFEAKPRRAVNFSEIKRVLIPETASENLIKELTARNIPYQVYDSSENARTDAIKQMDGIRFSLKDSDGRTLTKEQQEFFKNSKIRNSQGDLLVVYHGTAKSFNIFSKSKMGKHGSAIGEGYYFTPKKSIAEGYADGKNPRIIEAYLNVKNPLKKGNLFIDNEEVMSWIYEHIDHSKEYLDTLSSGVVGCIELIKEYTETKGGDTSSVLKQLGYDGIDLVNEIVIFDSNQAKYTTNLKPTKNVDMRFSLDTIKQYSQEDAKRTLDDTVDMFTELSGVSDKYDIRLANKAKLVKTLLTELNSKAAYSTTKLSDRAKKYVDEVVDNIVLRETGKIDIEEARATVEALRPYYHSMNLSSVKSEIYNIADLRLWSGGKDGMAWDSVLREIVEKYPQFEKDSVGGGNSDIETLLNVFDAYRQAARVLARPKAELSSVVGNLSEIKEYMTKQLVNTLSESGTQYVKKRKPTYMTEEEFDQSLPKKFSKEPDEEAKVAEIRRVTEPKQKTTTKEKVSEVKEWGKNANLSNQINFTNAQAGIEHEAKRLGSNIEAEVQRARVSGGAAQNMIGISQMNYVANEVVGKSLKEVFEPVFKRGDEYTDDFYEFLLNMHNIDRMSLEAKAQAEIRKLVAQDAELSKIVRRKNISETERTKELNKTENGKKYLKLLEVRNKPVFGDSVTEAESRKRIAELRVKHPGIDEQAKDVWKYNDNLLQYRVDAGLITQEQADNMRDMYPHYVPTYRDTESPIGTNPVKGKGNLEVKKTIKTAKGSDLDILDLSVIMGKQTIQTVRAASVTQVMTKLYDAAEAKQDFTNIQTKETAELENADIDFSKDKPLNNEVSFYRDGKRVTMKVSPEIFAGFEAFGSGSDFSFQNPAMKALEKSVDLFKKGVTAWNPGFIISNFARDFQEALFYTKNGIGKFIRNLPLSVRMMKRKDILWQTYQALGGTSNTMFDYEKGVYNNDGKVKRGIKKVLGIIEDINKFIEQVFRFNEFSLSIKNGESYEKALLDSAEITTNFSRGGKITKIMNRTLVPFLNPSVQGFSKLWRTVTGRKTARAWGSLIVRALILGIGAATLNDLLNGDDEEYKSLSLRDKENYYLLKVGDTFLKIPKGRVTAAIGTVYMRLKEYASGNERAFDGWASSILSMVTPVENMSRTIFAPFGDISNNRTWYGSEIEGRKFDNVAPSERYDESTSSIAIALGKLFDYSPKKIHYLIDQYSGVIGDVLLPITTNRAEKDMFSAKFTLDPVLSNRYSEDFYTELEETQYAKTAGDPIAALKVRFLNSVSDGVSDMYQQKRDIANSDLSDKEKRKQTRVIQALINETLKNAVERGDEFEQLLIDSGYEQSAVNLVSSKAFQALSPNRQTSAAQKLADYYYTKAALKVTGEEPATKYYLYEALGGETAALHLTVISDIVGDTDRFGKTISGSRKQKVHAYIEKLKLSALQKYILLTLAGYKPTEKGKAMIEAYLRKVGVSAEVIEKLW